MTDLDRSATIRISSELLKSAKLKSVIEDTTISEAVRTFLRAWTEDKIELEELEELLDEN